ncbi:hypothetical protein [Mycobacterium sp. SMC-4]|uniref:hypothetical protein n=1 Tax=Mycobacterium sp. SMC-4 TaxID=2857059 RepID=UPI003D0849AE
MASPRKVGDVVGSRARFGAAILLALLAMTGVGTAGADPRPAPGDEVRDSLSERRHAARVPGHQRDEPRPRCHRREPDCGIGLPDRGHDDLESSSDGGWPNTVLPGWTFEPPQAPPRVPPQLGDPAVPDIVDVVPGVSLPVSAPVGAPIAVPVLPVVPGVVAPRPGGSAGAAPRPEAPPARPAAPPPRAGRAPEPPAAVSNAPASATSHRVGYPDYLRSAGLPQIAAVALPGVAGILVLTGAGGLVGYRQAKAARAVAVRPVTGPMN